MCPNVSTGSCTSKWKMSNMFNKVTTHAHLRNTLSAEKDNKSSSWYDIGSIWKATVFEDDCYCFGLWPKELLKLGLCHCFSYCGPIWCCSGLHMCGKWLVPGCNIFNSFEHNVSHNPQQEEACPIRVQRSGRVSSGNISVVFFCICNAPAYLQAISKTLCMYYHICESDFACILKSLMSKIALKTPCTKGSQKH